jgi:hypothetical protein
MTQLHVDDLEMPLVSNAPWIDPLIGGGEIANWNWLVPARNTIQYTFNTPAATAASFGISISSTAAFNQSQQAAAREILAYVSSVTGLAFAETSSVDADLYFGTANLFGPSVSGEAVWTLSYSTDGDIVTRSTLKQYVFLDNREHAAINNTLVAGNDGYEVLLHEIGHTLGLKHPFESSPTLPPDRENTSQTVMSYTKVGGPYSTFRELDLAALAYLYGFDGVNGTWGVGGAGDFYRGTSENDVLFGRTGDDFLDGLSGVDTAIYQGPRGAYNVNQTGTPGARRADVVDLAAGRDGHDTLTAIERLEFADLSVALDLDGAAGMTAKLLGALFGPQLVQDRLAVAIGLQLFDAGLGYTEVAARAAADPLFIQLAGSASNTAFVNHVYRNVTGSLPSQTELAFYVNLLDSGVHSKGTLGVLAAETPLNQEHINLVGLQQAGLEYI